MSSPAPYAEFSRARAIGGAVLLSTWGSALWAQQTDVLTPISEEAFRRNAVQVFWMALAIVAAMAAFVVWIRWSHKRRAAALHGRLARLYQVAEHVLVAVDPGEIERLIVESASEVADTSHCFLLLARGRQLAYAAGTESLPEESLDLDSVAAPVLCSRNREVVEIQDAAKGAGVSRSLTRSLGRKALLYLPVVVGEDCLGVLEVEDRRKARRFPRDERDRLEHLARLCGLGMRLRDQRALKEQLHRSEKLAAVSELADAMAREFSATFERVGHLSDRAPTDRAEFGGGEPPSLRSRLDEIYDEVVHAESALERLLQFARPQDGHVQVVDLNVLVTEFADTLRRRPDDERPGVELQLSRVAATVRADPAHLEQVFLLLGRHAEHFAVILQSSGLKIYTHVSDQTVIVSIVPSDKPGQSLRALARQDQQIDLDRPGLGLSVCQSLIERAGGTLTVDRDSSLGFRIDVEYPLTQQAWQARPATRTSSAAAGANERPTTVLICEPDHEAEELIMQCLAALGCRVVPVSSAQEAIDLCGQIHFDWVFCSLHPNGMSGLDVCERVQHRVARFVFLTDQGVSEGGAAFSGPGRAVLQKPLGREAIDALLDSFHPGSVTVSGD